MDPAGSPTSLFSEIFGKKSSQCPASWAASRFVDRYFFLFPNEVYRLEAPGKESFYPPPSLPVWLTNSLF